MSAHKIAALEQEIRELKKKLDNVEDSLYRLYDWVKEIYHGAKPGIVETDRGEPN